MPQILQFEEPWDKLLIDNDVDKSSFSPVHGRRTTVSMFSKFFLMVKIVHGSFWYTEVASAPRVDADSCHTASDTEKTNAMALRDPFFREMEIPKMYRR